MASMNNWLRQFLRPSLNLFLRLRYYNDFMNQRAIRKKLSLFQNIDKSNIHYFQEKMLNSLFFYAQEHCPYYRKLFAERNVRSAADLHQLPLLTKDLIRKHRATITSNNLEWRRYVRMNTGGSTGEPLEFFNSLLCGWVDAVHQEHQFKLLGYAPGDLIAAFGGISVPEKQRQRNIYWVTHHKNKSLPYGYRSYSALYFNQDTARFYIEDILATKPAILRGYPSFLDSIAQYMLANKIELPFKIKGIELTSEVAFDHQIDRIKEAFNAKISFQYGNSETCIFAYTNDDAYEYICSPYYSFVEVLDENNRQVEIGQTGKVVVTGFFNYAMPFIRYDTGDMAIYGGANDHVVLLKKVLGRTQDFVVGADGRRIPITAIVFGQHYRAFRNILKWQIIQDLPGVVRILIAKDEGYSASDEEEIAGKFKHMAATQVMFEYVTNLDVFTARGKFRFFIQNLPPPSIA